MCSANSRLSAMLTWPPSELTHCVNAFPGHWDKAGLSACLGPSFWAQDDSETIHQRRDWKKHLILLPSTLSGAPLFQCSWMADRAGVCVCVCAIYSGCLLKHSSFLCDALVTACWQRFELQMGEWKGMMDWYNNDSQFSRRSSDWGVNWHVSVVTFQSETYLVHLWPLDRHRQPVHFTASCIRLKFGM